ncbi:MAG: hypothetical protein OEY75_06335 [Hylemonella sp.]|nr:hypothetical protein [Hylemonella sp.]MDH5708716.1 hypothetical protein [Hylemonella sp.]
MASLFRIPAVISRVLGVCAACCMAAAGAQEAADDALSPTRSAIRLTTETLNLPDSDAMNWGGAELLFDVGESLRLGIGSYGAMAGTHGGFITIGGAAEMRSRLGAAWWGHAGLFVGAGGGNSAPTLAGDGLFWRADLGLSYGSRYGELGFGLSHVRFPTGQIDSTQPYLRYEYPFYSLLEPVGRSDTPAMIGGAASDRGAWHQSFGIVVRHYRIPSSVLRVDAQPQHGVMQLLGVEWQAAWGERGFVLFEATGALGGDSSGYMQILGGAGYRWAMTAEGTLKLHAAAGPAGGGGVDTEGGLLFDVGLAWQQRLSARSSVELGVGEVRSSAGGFRAHSLGLKLQHHFGLPVVGDAALSRSELQGLAPLALRVRLAQQSYHGLRPQWRRSEAGRSVGNLGVQLDYFFTPHLFLTGQALAAASGHAGAYMTGQLGVGAQWPLASRWFVEGEALLGAAGGGGLATGSGLVLQSQASLGYRLSPSLSLLASRGRVRAVSGEFEADVVGVSLAYRFGAWVSP